MKKIILYLLCTAITGNIMFAVDYTSASDTANVTLEVVTLPNIAVDDINFGTYVIGQGTPETITEDISITGGTIGKEIVLSVPKEITLASGSNTVTITLGLENGEDIGSDNTSTVVIGAEGKASSEISASISADPNVVGDYTGSATIIAKYN